MGIIIDLEDYIRRTREGLEFKPERIYDQQDRNRVVGVILPKKWWRAAHSPDFFKRTRARNAIFDQQERFHTWLYDSI